MPRERFVPSITDGTLAFETLDRQGVPVQLRWFEDIDRPNRGWLVHEMAAWRHGERVGYLRVSFIPKANLLTFHPTLLHYMAFVQGWCIPHLFHDFHGPARGLSSLTEAEILDVGQVAASYLNLPFEGWTTAKAMMRALQGPLNRKAAHLFSTFRAFHVDKPLVDYVRTEGACGNGVPHDNRGQGIGLLLYGAVAHHLPTLGMRLHASGIQTEDAQRMWAFFRAQGWTSMDGARTLLDPHLSNHPHTILARCPSTQSALA